MKKKILLAIVTMAAVLLTGFQTATSADAVSGVNVSYTKTRLQYGDWVTTKMVFDNTNCARGTLKCSGKPNGAKLSLIEITSGTGYIDTYNILKFDAWGDGTACSAFDRVQIFTRDKANRIHWTPGNTPQMNHIERVAINAMSIRKKKGSSHQSNVWVPYLNPYGETNDQANRCG